MGWVLRLKNFPIMLYISVTGMTTRLHICKKLMYVIFWMSYAILLKMNFLMNYYIIFSN